MAFDFYGPGWIYIMRIVRITTREQNTMAEQCAHDCGSCDKISGSRKPQDLSVPMNADSSVRRVIGVVSGSDRVVFPVRSAGDISIMSINLLPKDCFAPVGWSGQVIGGTVKRL